MKNIQQSKTSNAELSSKKVITFLLLNYISFKNDYLGFELTRCID